LGVIAIRGRLKNSEVMRSLPCAVGVWAVF